MALSSSLGIPKALLKACRALGLRETTGSRERHGQVGSVTCNSAHSFLAECSGRSPLESGTLGEMILLTLRACETLSDGTECSKLVSQGFLGVGVLV